MLGDPLVLSARVLRPVLLAAVGESELAQLAQKLGVNPQTLAAPDGRILLEDPFALWHELPRLSNDPHFGLHAAERIEPAALGVVGCLAEYSANLRDAAQRGARFLRLLGDRVRVELIDQTSDAWFELFTELPIPPRHATEFSLAAMVIFTRRLLGPEFAPIEVQFPHARPADISEHVRLFGRVPTFNAGHARMLVAARWLDIALPRADARVCEILDAHAALLLRGLPADQPLDARIRAAYGQAVLAGKFDLAAIAERLGLSERTLQRRLADRGLSHHGELERTRHRLALVLLTDTDTPVKEVACRLGFSEPSAFTRAFRRWTGVSPLEYRQGR